MSRPAASTMCSPHAPCALALVLALALAACTGTPAPPAERCPVVPLRLLIVGADGTAVPALTLAADGALSASSLGNLGNLGDTAPLAKLDPKGCLIGKDGVWAHCASMVTVPRLAAPPKSCWPPSRA